LLKGKGRVVSFGKAETVFIKTSIRVAGETEAVAFLSGHLSHFQSINPNDVATY
jgi:hypothetical protein